MTDNPDPGRPDPRRDPEVDPVTLDQPSRIPPRRDHADARPDQVPPDQVSPDQAASGQAWRAADGPQPGQTGREPPYHGSGGAGRSDAGWTNTRRDEGGGHEYRARSDSGRADTGRSGRDRAAPGEPEREPLAPRFLHMVIIAVMLSIASTILTISTVVQFVLMAMNKGEPNERLAEFGEGLGIWIAKAARYQTAASETKPWPWTDID